MPQLDPNTFIYQYIGIIVLLIAVYSTLSYIVLPILLRLMLIRNLFLTTRQTSTDLVNIVSTTYQQLVSFKNPTRNFNLTDSFIINFASILNGWLNLTAYKVFNRTNIENKIVSNLPVLTQGAAVDYFILFLLVELDENE